MQKMSRYIAVMSKIPSLSSNIQQHLPKVKIININPDETNLLPYLNINKAEILIGDCNLLAKQVEQLSKVKWVQSTWAGVDKAITLFKQNNVSFTFTRYSDKIIGKEMSEYVIAHIYNHERNQRLQYENQSKAIWDDKGKITNYRLIKNLTIGILGLGNIGIQIANVLKMLGATIWGLKRTVPTEKISCIDKYFTTNELSELLKNCNYIINVMPSTECSTGMLNDDRLKDCQQKGSVFINIGRGSIIKEKDLIYALEQKWISAAILDVFEEEPLSPSSKLWLMPQVTISPHISGISKAEDVAKFCAENYMRYISGEELLNIVNLERGY